MTKSANKTILVLSAMPSEILIIQSALQSASDGKLAIYTYQKGKIGKNTIITAVTGVGVSNGAMCTALFVERFKPDAVIVSGTGSRFNPKVD